MTKLRSIEPGTEFGQGRLPCHQIVSAPSIHRAGWWVLAIVVAAQFMFGVDAFIVNVAIPDHCVELHASPAQIEAVIAILPYPPMRPWWSPAAASAISTHQERVLAGVFRIQRHLAVVRGFPQSGPELIAARLAQGATAALMCRRCLPPFILLFSDTSRGPRLWHLRHRAGSCGRGRLLAWRRVG